jgi:hypothetical protein
MMPPNLIKKFLWLVPCLVLAGGVGPGCSKKEPSGGGAKAPRANRVEAEADPAAERSVKPVAASVFVDRHDFGRDPFFSESSRRGQARGGACLEAEQVSAGALIKLAGIWPRATRPLALINETSFAPGETAEVTVQAPAGRQGAETRKVIVQCLEIRADSVLIRVEGEPGTRELQMNAR